MAELTESVTRLITELAKLPGIGKKSAERIAYYILRNRDAEALELARAIRDVKEKVRYCSVCYHLAESEKCSICSNPSRDQSVLCVVEQPRDVISLEMTGSYNGMYHVLLGHINPLERIGPGDLTIDALVHRVRTGQFRELIMATNPTTEGDGTLLHITNLLKNDPIKITRLARGITAGSVLEFANQEMLSDAMAGRQEL